MGLGSRWYLGWALKKDVEFQLVEAWSGVRCLVGRYWDCHAALSGQQAEKSGEAENRKYVAKNYKFQLITIWLVKF